MFNEKQKEKIRERYALAMSTVTEKNISFFKNSDVPLFRISDTYPGIWLEHAYDSVFFARLEPKYLYVAKNVLSVFLNNQKADGQLPCYFIDRGKDTVRPEYGYSQIQECVAFFGLCLEYYEMSGDTEFLRKAFEKGVKWIKWGEEKRMPSGKGLIESFCGFDDGHDNSPRKNGMTYDGRAKNSDAAQYPDGDAVLPMISPDVNAVYYGNLAALGSMAKILDMPREEKLYREKAAYVKKRIFEICYDRNDSFFYDVDKNGNMRKYLSISVTNVFSEHMLTPEEMDVIYEKHMKNPDEFYTPYPFPSIAKSDPCFVQNLPGNSWGYYSQALTALRCTRWMDFYGKSADFDEILEKWVDKQTFGNTLMFAQELNPLTGEPSDCSQWYSSCMLVYIYAVRRLKLL